jgi:hypothetical protein
MGTTLKPVQWLALAAAGSAAYFGASRFAAPDSEDDLPQPIVRAAAAARPTPVAAAAPPIAASLAGPPQRPAMEVGEAADAFRSVAWTPPPAVAAPPPVLPAAPAPAPPSAPALPFRLVGLLEQKTDRPTAFLARGEALLVVRAGDVIDGTYRIESLSAAEVVVTYLPLGQRQIVGAAGGQP